MTIVLLEDVLKQRISLYTYNQYVLRSSILRALYAFCGLENYDYLRESETRFEALQLLIIAVSEV